jgi:hypothetical protein
MCSLHLLQRVRAVLDFVLLCKLVHPLSALYAVFIHRAEFFAFSFLQIPLRSGHPCCQLIVPAAKPIVVFHHLATAHAGRTLNQNTPLMKRGVFALLYFLPASFFFTLPS